MNLSYPHHVYGKQQKPRKNYTPHTNSHYEGVLKGDLIDALGAALKDGKVEEGRKGFAESLLTSWNRYGSLSEKQWYWVKKLPAGPEAPNPAHITHVTDEAGHAGMAALFQKAKGKLKFPKLFLTTASGRAVKLYIAGPSSNAPGAINVIEAKTNTYLGRVHKDGQYKMPRLSTDPQEDVEQLLAGFAANPAAMAAAYGKHTGNCCFCGKELTDPKSVKVGYGPICADHWGLPWGN